MIIMHMADGLGNQLFIYAFGRYLSIRHNTALKLDISAYHNKEWRKFELFEFNIQAQIATPEEVKYFTRYKGSFITRLTKRLFKKIIPKYAWRWVEEDYSKFDSECLKIKDNSYVKGYFQSEKYFKEVEMVLREDLKFVTRPSVLNTGYVEKIGRSNSVCLHVRRGDFLKGSWAGHYALSLDYYREALNIINDNISYPTYFIFSDDMEWVKRNLTLNSNFYFVDHNKDNGVEDLRLMSCCKHFIIANSSFSWWGAWLSKNQNKIVIAPKVWQKNDFIDYTHITPSGWTRI